MVLPRKAIIRRPPFGSSARCRSKSPTTACTATPGYSAATAAAAERRVVSSTSKGTKRRSAPRRAKASSRSRVFSEVPEPSSISVSAPDRAAISPARSTRMPRSVRVG
jgi:hypothetical protein